MMLFTKRLSVGLAIAATCASAQAIDIVTTGDTTLSIGGYIKAEGLFNSPDDEDSEFKGNLRQSRINIMPRVDRTYACAMLLFKWMI